MLFQPDIHARITIRQDNCRHEATLFLLKILAADLRKRTRAIFCNEMGNRLTVTILSTTSIFALGQASKAPDASAGPVPPAIQQMPSRFQPPVPGCTDCYYTVPTGNVVGAMGTTNNEDIKVTNPRPQPPPIKPKVASSSKRAAPGASGGCKIGYKAITANGKRTCVKK
jgi:hypothetical protein